MGRKKYFFLVNPLFIFVLLLCLQNSNGFPASRRSNDPDEVEMAAENLDDSLEEVARMVRQNGESTHVLLPILENQNGNGNGVLVDLGRQLLGGSNNDGNSFSSPENGNRVPFWVSMKRLVWDLITGQNNAEGRNNGENLPWYKRLGRTVLRVLRFGLTRYQEAQQRRNQNQQRNQITNGNNNQEIRKNQESPFSEPQNT